MLNSANVFCHKEYNVPLADGQRIYTFEKGPYRGSHSRTHISLLLGAMIKNRRHYLKSIKNSTSDRNEVKKGAKTQLTFEN